MQQIISIARFHLRSWETFFVLLFVISQKVLSGMMIQEYKKYLTYRKHSAALPTATSLPLIVPARDTTPNGSDVAKLRYVFYSKVHVIGLI